MTQEDNLWVFGYGSLIWRPGFSYAARHAATLRGWRRSLCIYSHVYRGTPDQPGLVLGLDRGGACRGIAFQVPMSKRDRTIQYLREREQVTAVYLERAAAIALDTGERVRAVTYVADRRHPQYAGRLAREVMLQIVLSASGRSGPNTEYVAQTYSQLTALGVRDSELAWLNARLTTALANQPPSDFAPSSRTLLSEGSL